MPDSIAHYRLLDRISSNGLGELYRARDTKVGRTVAIRVLSDAVLADAARLDRLLQAARSAARLSHPNIAALFEVGDAASGYLAFEFVPGDLLGDKLGGRPLEVRRALDFAIQLADALAEAEAHGIAHGAIRPDTIVITPKDRPKFLHFGLSAFTTGAGADATAPWRSPEETASVAQDTTGDIRAFGLVMYEMLTGRQAFRACEAVPPSPGGVNAVVHPKVEPPELDVVLRKMLSTNVEKGYQTAVTLAAELRVVAAILDARSAAAVADVGPPRDGKRDARSLTTVVMLAALAALALWIWRTGVWRLSG